MKVIGAGFGRTGTMSLKVALETLGFGPCYHMMEVFSHPEHAQRWEAAWLGEPVDFDDLLEGYEAAVDWPACAFYEELMQRYPEAKVILTVRDPERWYESVRNTIYELTRLSTRSLFSRLSLAFISLARFGKFSIWPWRIAEEIVLRGTFDEKFEDKRHAIEVFERHNEDVRRRVPEGRLLTFEVKEGWGPMCEFLGVEAPDEPFPRLNDAAELRRMIVVARLFSVAAPAVIVVVAFLAVALLGRRAGS